MSETAHSDRIVLKILSGVQAGAEVSLTPGDYSIGSGADDDIQFIDVSLKEAHAKLRVSPGKIEISAHAGPLNTANGLHLAAGSGEWQEIEPLDIVTAGTMRFALGPPTANWTTLSQVRTDDEAPRSRKPGPHHESTLGWMASSQARGIMGPILILLILVFAAVWYITYGAMGRTSARGGIQYGDLETAQAAISQFPFAKTILIKQEVDGTIYATGFVESAVERRAILSALEKTSIPIRFRVGVLESLRNEIDNLIKTEKVSVTYSLSPAGELLLDGVILNEDAAKTFVDKIQGLVVGLKQIDSKIRTAKTLVAEIEKLARQAQIDSYVVFRLDGELVEVNGILPNDKIDAWVGFLQVYARRFGQAIALRSFVQLQNDVAEGKGGNQAIILGTDKLSSKSDTLLDLERLARGDYELSDLFVRSGSGRPGRGSNGEPQGSPGSSASPQRKDQATASEDDPSLPAPTRFVAGTLADQANGLIESWKKHDGANQQISAALDEVAARRAEIDGRAGVSPADYLPIFPSDRTPGPGAAEACRPGSRLTPSNLPMALFWLDLISVSTDTLITSFERDNQGFILEAALNPAMAARCVLRTDRSQGLARTSLYLAEAARNPDFVRFITRSLKPFSLDVAGINLSGQRYLQIRNGPKMQEGAAPDGASRLMVIGELGAAIQLKDGFSAVIYGPDVNWKTERPQN